MHRTSTSRAFFGVLATVFGAAALIWATNATRSIWVPRDLGRNPIPIDAVSLGLALLMGWFAFRYARSGFAGHALYVEGRSAPLPQRLVDLTPQLVGAVVVGLMGLMFWSWSETIEHCIKTGVDGLMWYGLCPDPAWLKPLERYTGFGLIFGGVVLLVRAIRSFLNRGSSVNAAAI